MGRPKVPDSKRRRAAIACSFCRSTKKKCSGTSPCDHCKSRGIADSCSLATSDTDPHPLAESGELSRGEEKKRRKGNRGSIAKAISTDSSPNAKSAHPVNTDSLRSSLSIRGDRVTANGNSQQTITASSSSDSSEALTRPRLLLNRRGEQVYIGQAASLSFLQLAREIVMEHIGPSEFSHNGKTQTMLETSSPKPMEETIVKPLEISLDLDQMLMYAGAFSVSVDGLMNLFAPSEVHGLIVSSKAVDARYRNPYKRATVDLTMAIGAQCTSPESAADIGQPFFQHAQKLAMSETLEDPSVDMIRAFLLMAFYMLGSCRRNAAFMYIGVATRAAVVLGLHSRASYTDMKLPRFQLRLSIWVSLCVLDMVSSAILGRPAATSSLRADLDKHIDDMVTSIHTHMDLDMLMASYKISTIVSDTVDNLYACNAVSGAFIEQYLNTIDLWKQDYGQHCTDTDQNSVGKVHVSCLYYFAVTLVTRPILASTLLNVQSNGLFRPAFSHMAQACVDAAIFLVQACVDAQDAGLLLGNMCILKALVFVAGLILGLRSFSEKQIDYKVEMAFSGARRNLEFLSVQSPQAAHYFEILRLLLKAVTRQREHCAETSHNPYVSKLYGKSAPFTHGAKSAARRGHDGTQSDDSISYKSPPWPSLSTNAGVQTIDSNYELQFIWDNFDLSLWDDFLHPSGSNPEF